MTKKKNKKKPSKNKRFKKSTILEKINALFYSNPTLVVNYKQVSKLIGLSSQVQRLQVASILDEMTYSGVLYEVDLGRYRLNLETVVGSFVRRSNGYHMVTPENEKAEIYVSEENSAHALNGDIVKVQLSPNYIRHNNTSIQEGRVVEILERKEAIYIGILQSTRDYAFLITEDKSLPNDIFIPPHQLNGGKNGDKAVVRITKWPLKAKNPEGEVLDILGKAGDNNVEMHAILAEFGLPYKYPQNVEKAANRIPEVISPEEIAKREDYRQILTFTIDPKDAKDFDDALSARLLENGNWEVGVHIADVTHYVKPDSVIDKEAQSRATSIYLVDRTIPMLPERLCNNICSLRPNEEKLCFAAIFELNENAEVVNSRICRTIIKSARRFTYEEAQNVIETGEGDCKEVILALNTLAKKLRDKRFQDGAINFDRYEVKFELDEKGKPISVYFKESKDANKLIEEFMLLANRTVAEFIGRPPKGKKKKTFVYRIHEQPDPDKLENFAVFVHRLGYKFQTTGKNNDISKSLNSLLNDIQGKPEENLIESVAIRAMQKAKYSVDNVGHYGLAFEYYTHFTSPIRRYPDMMVHRLLERYLADGRSVIKKKYEELCDHCSKMEQLAANAKRSSVKYKQAEFMKDKIGQIFDAVISGVTEWGLYVEVTDSKCEGLLPMKELNNDFYEFDEKNYCLIGKQKKYRYRLGDPIRVKLVQVNMARRQMDFILA